MNPILKNDLDELIENRHLFEPLSGKTVLVTGATGLIGSLLVKALLYWNAVRNDSIRVVAVIRDRQKAEQLYADCAQIGMPKWVAANLICDTLEVSGRVDYIVHTAAVTTSKTMITRPVETIQTALHGTESVLRLAAAQKAAGVVFLSSMEVYGSVAHGGKVRESDLGKIDLSAVRSCYPEGKRMCECMCQAYYAQYDVPVVVARLAQTFGAGISPTENRVFAQFARSALAGEDIVLRTEGKSEGNYVYTTDAIAAILLLLQKGEAGQTYNVANEDSHMTIRKMAELVAEELSNGKSRVVIDLPQDRQTTGYAPDVKLWLDAGKIGRLGWRARVSLRESYQRLAKSLHEPASN